MTMLLVVQDAGIKDAARGPRKACGFVGECFCLYMTVEGTAYPFASRMFTSTKDPHYFTSRLVWCTCRFVEASHLRISPPSLTLPLTAQYHRHKKYHQYNNRCLSYHHNCHQCHGYQKCHRHCAQHHHTKGLFNSPASVFS